MHYSPPHYGSVLQEPQATLHDYVLQDGSRGDVDGLTLGSDNDDGTLEGNTTAQVDGAGDGQVVELDHLGDRRDALLEVRDLLEIGSQLDERRISKAGGAHLQLAVLDSVEVRLDKHQVGASLDGQEAATGHVDTVSVVEVADGGTDSGLELDDRNV